MSFTKERMSDSVWYLIRWSWAKIWACSIRRLPSLITPEPQIAMWLSTSWIFLKEFFTKSLDLSFLSARNIIPVFVVIAITGAPRFTAFSAYSTCNSNPSGENIPTLRSYPIS